MQIRQVAIAVLTPLLSGITTFGAIAVKRHGLSSLFGAERVHAAAQSSPEPEALLTNWPQQCKAFQQALLHQAELAAVTYQARSIEPFVTPAWKLDWQAETLALPLADYDTVLVTRNEDGRYFVLLEDGQAEVRVILNQLTNMPPLQDVFTTAPHPSLSLAQLQAVPTTISNAESEATPLARKRGRSKTDVPEAALPEVLPLAVLPLAASPEASTEASTEAFSEALNWDGQSLTERLFDGPVALEQLIDEGYRHRPQNLSCNAESWEKELPIAIGLALKLSTGDGSIPEAAYAKVAQQPGRLLLYRSGEKTTWQARFGAGQVYADVTISLPSEHESAAVGLGMGQENWWDAEPRPEWLIALERAIEADTPYAWQALSVELRRAGMSRDSIHSIEQFIAE